MKKLAQVGSDYTAMVPVSISGVSGNMDIEPINKVVSIRFKIEFEARSWGIKGIVVTLLDDSVQVPVTITYWETGGDREEESVLSVDLKQLRQTNIQTSGSITLSGMELVLDKSRNIDYNRSSIEVLA